MDRPDPHSIPDPPSMRIARVGTTVLVVGSIALTAFLILIRLVYH